MMEPSRLLPPSSLRDPRNKRLMDETEGADDLSHTPSYQQDAHLYPIDVVRIDKRLGCSHLN